MTDRHTPPGPVTPPLDLAEQRAPHAAGSGQTPAGGVAAPPPVHRERRSRAVGWQSRDVMRTAALVIAMYLGIRLLWFAHALVLTVFLAVLFGLAVSAGVDRLAGVRLGRFRIPRGISAGLIVIAFFALLGAFGAWMAPTLRAQGAELRVRLPQAVDRIEDWVNRRQDGLFGMLLGSSGQGSAAEAPPAATGQPEAIPTPPSTTETLRQRLGGQMSGASRYLFPFLSSTLAVIAGFFIVVFVSIYIAADPKLYHSGLMHLFPRKARARAGEVLTAIATVLRRWLTTQLIAMLVIGVVTTVALLIMNVKAALALGVLAGLLEFVPTVGPILSSIPAIAMGFLDSPEKALSVAIVYMAIQFAENQLLIPLLMKGGVDLPPAVTILAQALFTLLFGFLGLMVAVPAMAAAMVAVKMLYVEDVVGDEVSVLGGDEEDD